MARVLVVADDLTGANATGARFARRGLRTISAVDAGGLADLAGEFDALVVNTASRHLPVAEAAALVRQAIVAAGPVELVVKRIDTTLRGNVGAELDAALTELESGGGRRVRALVVAAFPDAGRVTVGGLQLVDGVALLATDAARDPFTPVASSRVAEIVRVQCGRPIGEVPLDVVMAGGDHLREALSGGDDVVVCDALTDDDVRTVAAAAAEVARARGEAWLAVDPGPLGPELAAALGLTPEGPPPPPVLMVAGSVTKTTRDQLLEAERVLDARFVNVDVRRFDVAAVASSVLSALRSASAGAVIGVRTAAGEDDIADVDPGTTQRIPVALGEVVRSVLGEAELGGLYTTGGDVTSGVLAALGAEGVQLEHEVLPLAVAGRIVGGRFDGLAIATKGGLIGGPDAAVRCVEHLRRNAGRTGREPLAGATAQGGTRGREL